MPVRHGQQDPARPRPEQPGEPPEHLAPRPASLDMGEHPEEAKHQIRAAVMGHMPLEAFRVGAENMHRHAARMRHHVVPQAAEGRVADVEARHQTRPLAEREQVAPAAAAEIDEMARGRQQRAGEPEHPRVRRRVPPVIAPGREVMLVLQEVRGGLPRRVRVMRRVRGCVGGGIRVPGQGVSHAVQFGEIAPSPMYSWTRTRHSGLRSRRMSARSIAVRISGARSRDSPQP